MNNYTDVKNEVSALSTTLDTLAQLVGPVQSDTISIAGQHLRPGLGLDILARTLTGRANDLRAGVFRVIIFGEFNRGKSTLLNAMLRDKTLPTAIVECTAIITILVNGNDDVIQLFETGKDHPRLIAKPAFAQEFQLTAADRETLNQTGFIDRFEHIEYAQVPCQSSLCQNGVRLIDAPGLRASAIREKVANKYLRQSHAIVLLLDATMILNANEKEFIREEFEPGKMQNVFFVVNKVNLLNNAADVQRVKEEVLLNLKPYYTSNDAFDQNLYDRRVHYVNAYQAEQAGIARPIVQQTFEESGVAALEQELERFLTSDEKSKVVFDDTKKTLLRAVIEARQTINRQTELLILPLGELNQLVAMSEVSLRELEGRQQIITNKIVARQEIIISKLSSSLESHIGEMEQTWPEDSKTLGFDSIFGFGSMAAAVWNQITGNKDEIARRFEPKMKAAIDPYLKANMKVWSTEKAGNVINNDIDELVTDLAATMSDFSDELDEVYQKLNPDFKPKAAGDLGKFNTSQWVQLIFQLLMGDFGGMGKNMYDKGDWKKFILGFGQQLLVAFLAGIVGGLPGLIIFVVWEVFQVESAKDKFAAGMRQKVGTELFAELKKGLPAMQQVIRNKMEETFSRLNNELISTISEQIAERRAELEWVLEQRNQHSFSAESEVARLKQIESLLPDVVPSAPRSVLEPA